MEIPAKNTIGLSIKRVTFTSSKKKNPSFLGQYLLFSIFSLFLLKITLKVSLRPLLWDKNHNLNKILHLSKVSGNLNLYVLSYQCRSCDVLKRRRLESFHKSCVHTWEYNEFKWTKQNKTKQLKSRTKKSLKYRNMGFHDHDHQTLHSNLLVHLKGLQQNYLFVIKKWWHDFFFWGGGGTSNADSCRRGYGVFSLFQAFR